MKISKKLLYFSIPILTFIASCSKIDNREETPVTNQKLFNVSFNVSGFTSSVTPLPFLKSSVVTQATTQTDVKLSDQITKLQYLIYNSSGHLIKDSVQNNDALNFGTINLQMPAGSYKLLVAGISGICNIINKENITNVFISKYTSSYGIRDWFKQVSNFNVTEQALNQNIVLDRIVGKIGLVLTDAIPKDLAKITLGFTSGAYVYLNNSSDPATGVETVDFLLKPSEEGKLNFSSSAFVIPMASGSITTDVSIRAYNTSGTLIVEKIVRGVVVEKNKMTTLSGALFTSLSSNTTTNVTINDTWNPSTIVTF